MVPFEWGIVATGSAVVATLVVSYAVDWDDARHASREPAVVRVKAAAVRVPPVPPAPPRIVPRASTFVITAARGDSWLQVRAGSFEGRTLYEGLLSRGDTVRLRSHERLWMRFGAASHLDVSIGGRGLRLPAFGTFDAFAGPRGIRADRTDYATAAQSP
jgi:hypothetical protein